MAESYVPPQEILEKYADVMVNLGANNGAGVNEGDVVLLVVPECAKPFLLAAYKAVLAAGAHPLVYYLPDGLAKIKYANASDEQLKFYPLEFVKGRIAQIDHAIYVIADVDKHELDGVDPKKIMLSNTEASKKGRALLDEKENAGKFSWTLCLYGTQAMADEVGMSLEEYWQEIINACYLDDEDPLASWKAFKEQNEQARAWLQSLPIEKIHVQSEHIDLWLTLGERRKWVGFSGRNIPSFEIFTSPDWRGTQGFIRFTEPLYRYGNRIEDIYLEFTDGVVTKATAAKGEAVLKEMIAQEGANKVGEFSLTDASFSRIRKFMGETLYDENVGGEHGNTHIAVGKSYHNCFDGDPKEMTENDWEALGYNDSSVHTDIVSTAPRVVTATLKDGTEKIIYKDGHFTMD